MPVDRPVAFVAIDEIQLAADSERGHIFTDRLLHARGLEETMVMGSNSISRWIRALVPKTEFIQRPRFSTLTYAGPKKITRLPARSAVVAFSAAEVYAIADLIRRQRGGTAIVMGALSPRTRNAQVEMYQAGEVDYLVATDAIGMGLNMDVGHVCFAALRKFDGRVARPLTKAEISQIAGRAGRHMSDGTFGTTAEVGPMDPEIVDAVENHRVDPLTHLMWRRADLDFRSIDHLLRSLETRPPHPGLIRQQEAEDHQSLQQMARDPEIADLAHGRDRVALLWEVCQVPDFRKLMTDAHVRLLAQLYRFLIKGRLPNDWVADQIARLDRIDGDIDQLTQRIAHVRTWSFIANRADWVADPGHWQARAQEIEDRLSEALHAALTQRFVDRRRAALHRRLTSGSEVVAAVNAADEVIVEGHVVGTLGGLSFAPVSDVDAEEAKPLFAAARRALGPALADRAAQLTEDHDGQIQADRDRRHPVAPRHRGEPPAGRRAAASAAGAEGRRPARWRIPPHDRPAPAHLDRRDLAAAPAAAVHPDERRAVGPCARPRLSGGGGAGRAAAPAGGAADRRARQGGPPPPARIRAAPGAGDGVAADARRALLAPPADAPAGHPRAKRRGSCPI